MKKSYFFILISIFALLFFYLFYQNVALEKELKKLVGSFGSFEKRAKEIAAMKKKFDDKAEFTKKVKRLIAIKKPVMLKKENRKIKIEFDELSGYELDKIVKFLLNNNFIIKKIDISNKNNKCFI